RHDVVVARSNLEFQQQIIGIVGHDLRNPLATITASIGLLRRQEGLTRASVESLDRVARSAARMARLISDLLDYARTRAPGGLPELFKAYRRGIRGESTGRQPGLGLGLFIVAQIAAAHGGRASAESSAESGTTFTIQLPRSVARRGP